MSNIEYIRNITVFDSFNVAGHGRGELSIQLNSLPDLSPDEAIIRAINFHGDPDEARQMYLLWSNLNNDIVGSFCNGSNSTNSPQSVIKLTSNIPNLLEFKVCAPTKLNESKLVEALEGFLSIHIDFIKYKREKVKVELSQPNTYSLDDQSQEDQF